jgi:hypothetical protein
MHQEFWLSLRGYALTVMQLSPNFGAFIEFFIGVYATKGMV